MKAKVINVQSGVSSKSGKPYSFVWVEVQEGIMKIFDGTDRKFNKDEVVELKIVPSFDNTARVVIA